MVRQYKLQTASFRTPRSIRDVRNGNPAPSPVRGIEVVVPIEISGLLFTSLRPTE